MIPQGSIICDIGCDHGLLPIYLIKSGHILSAIAIDIGEGPLAGARSNIQEFGLEDKIALRLGNGFSALKPNEADTAVIAGMGGMLMLDILRQGKDKWESMNSIILSPQRDEKLIREYMSDLCYYETDMTVFEGNEFYSIMKFNPQRAPYAISQKQKLYGINPSVMFLEHKKNIIINILDSMSNSRDINNLRKETLMLELEILDDLLGK